MISLSTKEATRSFVMMQYTCSGISGQLVAVWSYGGPACSMRASSCSIRTSFKSCMRKVVALAVSYPLAPERSLPASEPFALGGLRGPTSALDLAKRLVAVGQMLWKSFLFLSALEQLQRAFGPDPVEVIVKVLPDTVGVHASSVFIIGAEHGRQGGGMRLELRGSVVKRGEDDGLSTRNRRAPHARLSQLARSRGGTSSAAGVRK